jgi:hypothetical protein
MHTVRDFTVARTKALVIKNGKVQLIQGNELDKEYKFVNVPRIGSIPALLAGMKIPSGIPARDLQSFGAVYDIVDGMIIVPFAW